MKPGAAVIDVSIDQGGCVETSRPTTLAEPTFVYHGVTHFCVPNFTADLGRSASVAIAQAHAAVPARDRTPRRRGGDGEVSRPGARRLYCCAGGVHDDRTTGPASSPRMSRSRQCSPGSASTSTTAAPSPWSW